MTIQKRRLSAALLIGVSAGCGPSGLRFPAPEVEMSASVKEARARIREITTARLQTWTDSGHKPILIDVRTDEEWQAGHAAGAIHIGRWTLADRIGAAVPDKASCVLLYCQSGMRSALAADKVQKMGYTSVYSLAGGFRSYRLAGLPVEK